ncbi:MAG TPA: nitrilase-related carbon-nitrogen hydrolase [Panacibacter sp.]|nr:nitrilase-related carbon-nitrogen hydrolase [Panacibacter sp.]HNP45087.1 nitrilase-related carbon-nitrogen hydrolase [Panacibacter sp.]
MKTNASSTALPVSTLFYAISLLAGALATVLLSPKWVVPVMAWVGPGLLLFYFRHAALRYKISWFCLVMLVVQMISAYDVAPFPLPVLAITSVIELLKMLLIYSVDRAVTKRYSHFITTLVFPAAYVSKEFFDVSYAGGAWWSIANTQYAFHWLAQLSSVTGLTGISFLIYWFASTVVWIVERRSKQMPVKLGVAVYAGVFIAAMLFGISRYTIAATADNKNVPIAGVTVPSFEVLQSIYKDVTGKEVVIDPKISISSPELQQINAAYVPFIEHPDAARFPNSFRAIAKLHDSLFTLSKKAADAGAKIIVWSEGNAVATRAMDNSLIMRGENFAAGNKVYLLMAMAVFDSGKIVPATNFLENKTVFIGPDGKLLNVFHKNHPVPFAEHSTPGDGIVPVINTPYGKISPSICYDADIPSGMKQLAQNKTDLLLLPSGDWYAIAPYHSYMAIFRGIENGCTVVRQASGGLSLSTDYRGKTLAQFDFYGNGEKTWNASIPVGHVATVYAQIGDVFPYACIVFVLATILFIITKAVANFIKGKSANKKTGDDVLAME